MRADEVEAFGWVREILPADGEEVMLRAGLGELRLIQDAAAGALLPASKCGAFRGGEEG